jgi:hypothetical protein
MYVTNNYIFLDCEGLGKEGTERDIRLLLIPYLISNVIIMNDSDDFNDSLIKKLEPLTTLSKFIDIDRKKNKPELIFRIRNYELDGDIKKTLETKIQSCKKSRKKNDVSKTIITTLEQLFNKLHIYSTPDIDKSDKLLLKNKSFNKLLENTDNNFDNVISSILDISDKTLKTKYSILMDNIKTAIHNMNTNSKISAEIFDVTKLVHKNEILEFINKIEQTIYNEIIVDGSKLMNVNIEYRIRDLNKLLEDYDKQFASIDPDIKKINREEIRQKIQLQIDNAITKSKSIVQDYHNRKIVVEVINELNNIIREINTKQYHKINFTTSINIYNKKLDEIINLLDVFTYGHIHKQQIKDKIEKLNTEINKILQKQEADKKNQIESIRRKMKVYDQEFIIQYISDNKMICIETFDTNVKNKIIEIMTDDIRQCKFTYITFSNINLDEVRFIRNELIEVVDYNNYSKYRTEYENEFKMTKEIREVYNNKMEEEIKEYSKNNVFNINVILNNPELEIYYITGDLISEYTTVIHNNINSIIDIFEKKAKIYFMDEIIKILEENKIDIDYMEPFFVKNIRGTKSTNINIGVIKNEENIAKKITYSEYLIRKMSDQLCLNRFKK